MSAISELMDELRSARGLSAAQAGDIRAVFSKSDRMGNGNPAITEHPMSRAQCSRSAGGDPIEHFANQKFTEICGAPYMAPLYDPSSQHAEDATACIDQFEYPNLPCAFPIVWTTPREAAEICEIEGKRLCDAHEWEGACAGSLQYPDYDFSLAEGRTARDAVSAMRESHNAQHAEGARWSYGDESRTGICAAGSSKTPTCDALGGYNACGSNTYPAGSFLGCVSPFGVYDLHGNVAEIMNLPLSADEMGSTGSEILGVTELKGSWFIWDTFAAHPDWCRWRAPFWHGGPITAQDGHANYHLGFRCCKSLE